MTGLSRHLIVPLAALGLLVAVVGGAFAQEPAPTDLLTAANERYERGEYAEAAQQYEALIYRGYEDVAIYYNLGNTYSRRGDFGTGYPELPAGRGVVPPRPGHSGQPGPERAARR